MRDGDHRSRPTGSAGRATTNPLVPVVVLVVLWRLPRIWGRRPGPPQTLNGCSWPPVCAPGGALVVLLLGILRRR